MGRVGRLRVDLVLDLQRLDPGYLEEFDQTVDVSGVDDHDAVFVGIFLLLDRNLPPSFTNTSKPGRLGILFDMGPS